LARTSSTSHLGFGGLLSLLTGGGGPVAYPNKTLARDSEKSGGPRTIGMVGSRGSHMAVGWRDRRLLASFGGLAALVAGGGRPVA
jgi:hypothetical protein